MIHNNATNDEPEEVEEINDEDATLADDLLDEVGVEDTEDDAVEGFGILPEVEEAEEDEKEKDEFGDDSEELEEDAEDVDFDTFDDVDEL